MARVLVTRAEPGASATAAKLAAGGHQPLLAPMLIIEAVPADPALIGIQAVLFTSSNGARAFAAAVSGRDLPVFCIGDATAAAARSAGFATVRSADGDVAALAALVAGALAPDAGRLLHAAGADLAGDLAGDLRARGFDVEIRTYYRALTSPRLPAMVEQALGDSPPAIDAVLFHSARAAATFATLVKQREGLARIDALCLSEAVADAVRPMPWRRVLVAGQPQEQALLLLLATTDSDQGRAKPGPDSSGHPA